MDAGKRNIAFPIIANYNCIVKFFIEKGMDLNYIEQPKMTRRTLDVGTKYSPDYVCAPFKSTLGSMIDALEAGDFPEFLRLIRASGNSSFQYLQNVSSRRDPREQPIALALAVSDKILDGRGAARVHGGGFAGTIQAFVPEDLVEEYKKSLDGIFGEGACHVLRIRKYGGMKVI